MSDDLRTCEVFKDLEADAVARIQVLAQSQSVEAGDHLFLLGQAAHNLYVVRHGQLDLCLPISILGSVKEVTVESKGPGSAVGWSALLKPHRFRLSARAAVPTQLTVLSREGLQGVLAADPQMGFRLMERIAQLIAERLLTVQALWARELQRYMLGAGQTVSGA